ncbi:hypothetical protein L218DRAFT_113032 [Marasmius fiardii PR-910]|nr:hypothetical protein L218DRAFT_113032 [Marasmius fiardii PR-910]
MPPDPWLSAAKSLASTASGVAGVPGLSAGVDALCALISLCEVSANRNATHQLCERCHTLLLAVEKYEPQPPNTLKRAFDDATKYVHNGCEESSAKMGSLPLGTGFNQLELVKSSLPQLSSQYYSILKELIK